MSVNINNSNNYLILEILSLTRRVVNNVKVSAVLVPTEKGYIKILPNHATLITKLSLGDIEVDYIEGSKKEEHFFVVRGYCYVINNKVIILGEIIERPKEINRARAEAALKRARERLLSFKDDVVVSRALAALKRAEERINFFDHYASQD